MAEEHISVAVQDDFLARQTRAKPIPALAELIWNGLDGDATRVDVELKRDNLAGGLSQIIVYDNGDGFSRADGVVLKVFLKELQTSTVFFDQFARVLVIIIRDYPEVPADALHGAVSAVAPIPL
jgi:Histidine kinase-, DNA gyrase B-, and HSP90-like ATPase